MTIMQSDQSSPRPADAADHAGVPGLLDPSDVFAHRHIGPDDAEVRAMLDLLGRSSLEELAEQAVPADIRFERSLELGGPDGPGGREAALPLGEHDALGALRRIAERNTIFRSCIGMGYHDCITPPVILRNILENPGWYTAYTPYQAEIAQGRLEALINFQTMVSDLTGLPLANASLLDEATAAAEAMTMCLRIAGDEKAFFVSSFCHPQTIEVVRGRAEAMGIDLVVGDETEFDPAAKAWAGVLLQYPGTDGRVCDHRALVEHVHEQGGLVVMAVDLLALTLIASPGDLGADIAVGSSQRFGVPLGAGGPHAAFMATSEAHVRKMPGRIIGVSRDVHGRPAFRMAIQTREQHIRRERATSNICTAQVLLAIVAGAYAVYHGPEGLRRIARRVRAHTLAAAEGLRRLGQEVNAFEGEEPVVFDTIRVKPLSTTAADVIAAARERGINLRDFGDGTIGIAFDETTTRRDVLDVLASFSASGADLDVDELAESADRPYAEAFARQSGYLTHEVFNTHHSEAEMTRYLKRLESRDLSLVHSMIPLGSCTMKLNATSEMIPVTWPEFGRIHPFAPAEQQAGYVELCAQLESWLAEITGFDAVSLQPNSGAQGEYAGLMVIRAYHRHRGQDDRRVCIIPTSAHGTNPASAIAAGYEVVPVQCDEQGAIDLDDLRALAEAHRDRLGAFMITYPSTFGVFDPTIREMCSIIHEHGGLVYLDGANMNAQVGLCRPGDYGADVCHLNLHKTFCIPHGGGGPGMGPIGVTEALRPFLPGHPVSRPDSAGEHAIAPISAAPYGSPSILVISWMYIAMMGAAGLEKASRIAILNANYMAKRLEEHYDVLYRGKGGLVAHEFIIDARSFDRSAGIRIDDIAKRLMDYGFHAPTMAWPVAGTLMVEPTESESKAELDRLCDALIGIRAEIRAIEDGRADREDNVLRNAPHTAEAVSSDAWSHPYGRAEAAWPAPWLRESKFWPPVGRIDNPYGDRNLMCTCPPMDAYAEG